MKVLSVNKYYQLTGGGDRFFFDSMKILSDRGNEVIPFCLDYAGNSDTPYRSYFPKGVSGSDLSEVSASEKALLFFRGIYSISARKALRRLVFDCQPDVAHLHILHFTLSPSLIDELYTLKVPIVFSLHDYRISCTGGYLYRSGKSCMLCAGNRFYNAAIHRCYRNSTAASLMGALGSYVAFLKKIYTKVGMFTVPHAEMRDIVISLGLPAEKVAILKNPFLLTSPVTGNDVDNQGNYVLFFGSFTEQKGVLTLLRAASLLPHIPFIFCGNGPVLKIMQKKIEDEGMLNVTIDTSSRWNSGLQRLIAGARLVVSPSEWPAPMEYVTLEAMSFGKAVIASDIGGHRSVISSGRNGLLFKAGDSDSLMNEITKLYENDKLCGELGRGALLTIKDEFDPKVFYRDVICILSSAMAENY